MNETLFFGLCITEEKVDIIRPLSDKTVTKIPDTVTFECEFSPAELRIDWYKGDRELRGGEKYEITQDGGVHRLIIHDVDGRDIGDYSARYRQVATEAKLDVQGRCAVNGVLVMFRNLNWNLKICFIA